MWITPTPSICTKDLDGSWSLGSRWLIGGQGAWNGGIALICVRGSTAAG
jgi:hypothetical protein